MSKRLAIYAISGITLLISAGRIIPRTYENHVDYETITSLDTSTYTTDDTIDALTLTFGTIAAATLIATGMHHARSRYTSRREQEQRPLIRGSLRDRSTGFRPKDNGGF